MAIQKSALGILGIFCFLLIIIFLVLPFSIMALDFESSLQALQNYSIALVATGRTIGIGLGALVVSDIIKRVLDFLVRKE